MKKSCFLYYSVFLTTACLTLTLHAQPAKQTAQLDAYFAKAVQDWRIPGMAVAIVKDDQVVLAKGYGVQNSTNGGQVDENTLFAIASNTKAFNAAALAILVDADKLSWNDRVQQHLPYFQLYDSYVSHEMRIRDLLSHRSGLGTFSGDLLWYGTKYSAEEVVRRVRFLPAAGQFRSSYGYSNIMFLAAGEVVPAVTGKSWRSFVQKRILDEIGMNNTVMSTNALKTKNNVASPHKEVDSNWQPLEWYNWDATVAAGGIISSVSNMAKWMRLQLNRGELDGT
ncbi:MAG: serine hydrolase domain-containing protein, partial [bacterium]